MKTKTLPVDTVDQLLKALFVVSRTSERVLEAHVVKAALGQPFSPTRVQVLRLLGHRGKQTAGQVARFLGVTKPAVSQIIDQLVRRGLVTRRTATHDRREVGLELTRRGRQKFQAIRNKQRHLLRNAARLADQRDINRWIESLQEIASAVARADRTFQQFCAQCGAHTDGSCVLVGGETKCHFLEFAKGVPVGTASDKVKS